MTGDGVQFIDALLAATADPPLNPSLNPRLALSEAQRGAKAACIGLPGDEPLTPAALVGYQVPPLR